MAKQLESKLGLPVDPSTAWPRIAASLSSDQRCRAELAKSLKMDLRNRRWLPWPEALGRTKEAEQKG
jgi:hypothetical protein